MPSEGCCLPGRSWTLLHRSRRLALTTLPLSHLTGKVHGSLARAGKVRGQTPKVAKQERTKKPATGRAMKRLKYVRRFVNVGTYWMD